MQNLSWGQGRGKGALPGVTRPSLSDRTDGASLGAGRAEAAGAAQPEAAALREEGVGAHTCQSSPELLGNFVSLD